MYTVFRVVFYVFQTVLRSKKRWRAGPCLLAGMRAVPGRGLHRVPVGSGRRRARGLRGTHGNPPRSPRRAASTGWGARSGSCSRPSTSSRSAVSNWSASRSVSTLPPPPASSCSTVFGAIAHFERRLISERTRDGLTAARRRVRQPGRPPLGPETVSAARKLIGTALSPARAPLPYSEEGLTEPHVAEIPILCGPPPPSRHFPARARRRQQQRSIFVVQQA